MTFAPIQPAALPLVPGLETPKRFYQVLRSPSRLAGMPFPARAPWKAIGSAGFQSVVCLTDDTPPYDPSPLQVLRAVRLKDLFEEDFPDEPELEAEKLRDVVRAVVRALRTGNGVVVHCASGTGRTGTVIACVLASFGMPETAVLTYMKTVNAIRGEFDGWPESPWQRAQVAKFLLEAK